MSTNCLVTKLKGSVSNDDLQVLGHLTLRVRHFDGVVTDTARSINIKSISPVTVSVVGDGYVYADTTSTGVKSLVIQGGASRALYFDNADMKILISNKYDIREIVFQKNSDSANTVLASIDFDEIDHIPDFDRLSITGTYPKDSSLSELSSLKLLQLNLSTVPSVSGSISSLDFSRMNSLSIVSNAAINGDISVMQDAVNMKTIQLSSTPNVVGDIAVLGGLPALTVLVVPSATGSLESFVSRQKTARTQGFGTATISIGTMFKSVTFGGKTHANAGAASYLRFFEANDKIVVGNGGDSFDNCTTVYTKGYTQAEAEEAFPGKTIIRTEAE